MAVSQKRVVFVLVTSEALKAAAHTSVMPLLTDFFMEEFGYDEEVTSALVSALGAILFLMCIPGSFLGDTYLGRYKTMYLVSVLAVVAMALFNVGAFTFLMALRQTIFFIGLMVLACAYGLNRANTFALTAEQYRPDQKKEHDNAITYLFVMVNIGATFAMVGSPILRSVIGCFGRPSCYQIPWFTTFCFAVISLLMYAFALKGINKKQVREKNAIARVYKCIRAAMNSDENAVQETKEQYLERNPDSINLDDYKDDEKIGPLDSWLDNAYPRFNRRFIFDVRQIYRLALIFIPFILFWSVWYQQFSSWMVQGRYLNGRAGSLFLTSEVIYGSNPVLCVIFVSLLSFVVYPFMEKRMKLTALRKIGAGIAVTAFSFVLCTLVWVAIYSSMEKPADGKAFVFDFTNCSLKSSVHDEALVYGIRTEHALDTTHTYTDSTCGLHNDTLLKMEVELANQNGWIYAKGDDESLFHVSFKYETISTVIRFLVLPVVSDDFVESPNVTDESLLTAVMSAEKEQQQKHSHTHLHFFNDEKLVATANLTWTNAVKDSVNPVEFKTNFVSPEKFILAAGNEECVKVGENNCESIGEVEVRERLGGTYAVLVNKMSWGNGTYEGKYGIEVHELVPPPKVSVLTQIAQFTFMALGESIVSHTGLQFAYTQASPSMKSVINGLYLTCGLLGNVFNMTVLGTKFTENHMIKSIIFTVLLVIDFILFIFLARKYVYIYDQENPTAPAPGNPGQSNDLQGPNSQGNPDQIAGPDGTASTTNIEAQSNVSPADVPASTQ